MDEITASDVRAAMREAARQYLDTSMEEGGKEEALYTLASGFRALDTGTARTKDGRCAFDEDEDGYPAEYGPWSAESSAADAWETYHELRGEGPLIPLDVQVDEDIDETGIPWRDRCTAEDPCPTRAAQGGGSCRHV